nr:HAMP domain-containing sensor histidine kinase [uncultured Psychrobacter sp.]
MKNRPQKTLSAIAWSAVLRVTLVTVLTGFLLSVIYGLVYHYKQKQQHVDQLAALLTTSASTPAGANLIADQVRLVLANEPSIESIRFYSTTYSIADNAQDKGDETRSDWQNALFSNTASFNYPVISRDVSSSTFIDEALDASADTENQDTGSLVGYLNITLDTARMRSNWLQDNLLLWLFIVGLSLTWIMFILRKINWFIKDVDALTDVFKLVIENPELKQLPVTKQRLEFKELMQAKHAFITLFERLKNTKRDYKELAILEQQLHNKDLSLNLQRHTFQSMINHELKTSLNAIVGGLQLLDSQGLNIEQKDTADIINKGAQQLVIMLDQIMLLNQIDKGQISIETREFNPLEVIADLLAKYEPIAQQKGLALVSHIHHIDYVLQGDVNKIKQMVSTLLDNAIKFTTKGEISLQSQLTHFDRSNRWQIVIKDTGIGIDADYLNDIFDPFFQADSSQTRQYEGSGIGLTVVRQMAQLIGATVEVESTPNVGSQFTLTIPMSSQHHTQQQSVFSELTVIYYYYREKGHLAATLERLGAHVHYHQYEKSVIEQMSIKKVDIVMCAEDVQITRVISLTKSIRQYEKAHRALIIYWYPPQQAPNLGSFEHGIKAVGVDYCHSSDINSKTLMKLIKEWLAWI